MRFLSIVPIEVNVWKIFAISWNYVEVILSIGTLVLEIYNLLWTAKSKKITFVSLFKLFWYKKLEQETILCFTKLVYLLRVFS